MSTGDSTVQVYPADQAFDVRTFEVGKPGKPGLKRKETMAQHDARLYGSDKISQHIKKYDTNGDGNFSVAEVRIIIEEMERDENQVKSLKKVVAGVVFLSIIFMGILMGIILGVSVLCVCLFFLWCICISVLTVTFSCPFPPPSRPTRCPRKRMQRAA